VSGDRDRLLAELQQQADRRQAAQAVARDAIAEIAKLLPAAIEAGISKREISRRTGLSRVTIDELLRRRAPADDQ
jgi:lambda repressor-like predicted transcriptional regulator